MPKEGKQNLISFSAVVVGKAVGALGPGLTAKKGVSVSNSAVSVRNPDVSVSKPCACKEKFSRPVISSAGGDGDRQSTEGSVCEVSKGGMSWL